MQLTISDSTGAWVEAILIRTWERETTPAWDISDGTFTNSAARLFLDHPEARRVALVSPRGTSILMLWEDARHVWHDVTGAIATIRQMASIVAA